MTAILSGYSMHLNIIKIGNKSRVLSGDNMSMELINRKDLDDSIEYLTNEYGWLLSLDDDNLIKEVIENNNVQNALSELFGFIEEVVELPVIATEVEDYGGNPNIENTDNWLDIN